VPTCHLEALTSDKEPPSDHLEPLSRRSEVPTPRSEVPSAHSELPTPDSGVSSAHPEAPTAHSGVLRRRLEPLPGNIQIARRILAADDALLALCVKRVVDDELSLQDFVVAQPERREAVGNPAQALPCGVRLGGV
jgi:hypothetical protein